MIRKMIGCVGFVLAVGLLAGCGSDSDSGGGSSNNGVAGDAGTGTGTGGGNGGPCLTTSDYECFNEMCRCADSNGDFDIPEDDAEDECEVTVCE